MEVVKKDEENKELVTKEEIKDTPFTIVGTEQGYFGTVGNYKITELEEDKETLKKELKKITWNRIIQVLLIVTETTKTNKI